MSNKILIIYYSWSGNIKKMAEEIQKYTQGEIFEIQPLNPYSKNYNETVAQSRKEVKDSFHPKLKETTKDLSLYDAIFVGTPNWISTMAPPVASFLASNNFKGKKVLPFYSHGGGGLSNILKDLKTLLKDSIIKTEFGVTQSLNSEDIKNLHDWIDTAL